MPSKRNMPKSDRHLFFIGVLLTTFIASVYTLKSYISVIFLALILSIVVHPIYLFLKKRFDLGVRSASLATMLITFFLIILPVIMAINLFIQEVESFNTAAVLDIDNTTVLIKGYVGDVNIALKEIPALDVQINPSNVDKFVEDLKVNISTYVMDRALEVGASSVKVVSDFFIFLVLLYFVIPVLPNIKRYILKISPLDDHVDEMYIDRSITLIISMIKSIFIIALAQGLLGGLFLWIAGIEYIVTLTILMIILSVIPVIGTGFVTIPIGIYLILHGDLGGGLIVILGQVLFISNIDNILRAELLSRDTSLHPAIMLLGIIGGLQVFGFLGLLYGPIVIILFLTSLEIYTKHYRY